MNQIFKTLATVTIIISLVYGTYDITKKSTEARITPLSDLIWIDSNRVHKDSIIFCSPIYDEPGNIVGSWIRVSYQDTIIYIECLDTDDYKWKEFRDSWIMAFKEGGLK